MYNFWLLRERRGTFIRCRSIEFMFWIFLIVCDDFLSRISSAYLWIYCEKWSYVSIRHRRNIGRKTPESLKHIHKRRGAGNLSSFETINSHSYIATEENSYKKPRPVHENGAISTPTLYTYSVIQLGVNLSTDRVSYSRKRIQQKKPLEQPLGPVYINLPR